MAILTVAGHDMKEILVYFCYSEFESVCSLYAYMYII